MMTFSQFSSKPETIPTTTSWYLADLSEARGKHDPWPYMNYILYILKTAYREFEERVGQIVSPKGARTELIISIIGRHLGPFRISDIQKECQGVSLDLIRSVLKKLRSSKKVKCLGRGQNAVWEKAGKWK
jgi:hypothetical protein